MNNVILELKMPFGFEDQSDTFKELLREYINSYPLKFERFNSVKEREEDFNMLQSPIRVCTVDLTRVLNAKVKDVEICDTDQFQCFVSIETPEDINKHAFLYPRCFKIPTGEIVKIIAIDYIENGDVVG